MHPFLPWGNWSAREICCSGAKDWAVLVRLPGSAGMWCSLPFAREVRGLPTVVPPCQALAVLCFLWPLRANGHWLEGPPWLWQQSTLCVCSYELVVLEKAMRGLIQEASNTDFAFFWKTEHQGLCSFYRLPCRICGEIQAACTGQISVLGESPVSTWCTQHHQEATRGCRCGFSPTLDRCQPRRHRHTHRLQRLQIRPPMTPRKPAVAAQGDLRAESLKVMLRWDEMRWDEMRWYEMRWDEMRWDEISFIGNERVSKRRQLLSLLTATAAFTTDKMSSKQWCCYGKSFLLLLWILFLFLTTEVLGVFFSEKLGDNKTLQSLFIKQSSYLRCRSHSQSGFGSPNTGIQACPFHNVRQ